MRLAVDTGGTFTDFVYREGNTLRFFKLPSTPLDPSQALISGVRSLAPKKISLLIHGSTVATNAFLERKGAKVVLITTKGFEDLIFIGRQARPDLYDIFAEKPAPIISEENIYGICERISPKGEIIKALTETELNKLSNWLKGKEFDSCAVSLLHCYANPIHEQMIKKVLENLQIFDISLSSEILPEFREYERLSTTVINSYLNPVMRKYLKSLGDSLQGIDIFIQQSSGGYMTLNEAMNFSVHTVLSGPAGGVLSAKFLGELLGENRLITLDMGGTSTDVALINGSIPITRNYYLDGFPLRIPLIDIHTVGAGGGSIAYIDTGGILKVGPQSAGADPGPACYGKSLLPTVTDANLVLGRLLPDCFMGGSFILDKERSIKAIKNLAQRLNKTIFDIALAIVRIANCHMLNAIRKVTLERGYDPRDFTLLVYGGAGGLHACSLAKDLGIAKVILPKSAPVFSALGIYLSGFVKEISQTVLVPLEDEEKWKAYLRIIEDRARDYVKRWWRAEGDFLWEVYVDLRYLGQGFEVTVPLREPLREAFEEVHRKLYGFTLETHPIEIVTLRVRVAEKRQVESLKIESQSFRAPCSKTKVYTEKGWIEVPVICWDDLRANEILKGPALVIDRYTTLYLEEDFVLKVLEGQNLLLLRVNHV